MYIVRKRPSWFPGIVEKLYQDVPGSGQPPIAVDDDGIATRRKLTWCLASLFFLEFGPLPVTVLTTLYVIRKRPNWFRNTIAKLYAGQSDPLLENPVGPGPATSWNDETVVDKYRQIQRVNRSFSRSIAQRNSVAAFSGDRSPSQ